MAETKVKPVKAKKKKKMGEQSGKILKNIIIIAVFLAIVAGVVIYSINNSAEVRILGTWEATTEDNHKISIKFTDEYENKSTKETLYYITVEYPDGKIEEEKGTYNISTDTMMTLRPSDASLNDSATVAFKIKGDKLVCKYTRDFEEKEFVLTKAGKAKKEK